MFKNSPTFFRGASRSTRGESDFIIQPAPSPYYTNTTINPVFIILHCIGYNDPLTVLEQNQVSTHYLIPEQNSTRLRVFEVVKPPLKAWHAGISQWQNYTNLNNYAIGIEINMPNYMRALENGTLDPFYFNNFQSAQITALQKLIAYIRTRFNIAPENIIGHSDIAPWRLNQGQIDLGKTDPGPTLPWQQLAKSGIGVWPKLSCSDSESKNLTASNAQNLLRRVGYNVPLSGEFDRETNLTIGAARLHWRNNCFTAENDTANDCYREPFDRDLACALNNLARQNYQQNSNGISPMVFVFAIGTPLLILLVAILVYKFINRRRDYQNLDEDQQGASIRPSTL